MLEDPRLLLCYDGSDQAIEAIGFAAALFPPGTPSTVLYAWQPAAVEVTASWTPLPIPRDAKEQEEARALEVAEAGVRRARALGEVAPEVEQCLGPTVRRVAVAWQTIVDAAGGDVDLIVTGTRGRSGVRSLLLGSASQHVADHAACPVLIVPDAELGEARRGVAQANGRVAG
jgi:nucleotide-binding universal stress UspA family protein